MYQWSDSRLPEQLVTDTMVDFAKAWEDIKTAHVQEVNSLELEIENLQQSNNAMEDKLEGLNKRC